MNQKLKRIIQVLIAIGLLALWVFVFVSTAEAQTVRHCVAQSYTREIGVREATGKNDGKSVEKYLASTNLTKGYAWCAAFINWNLSQCGATHNNSAWSPDWFPRHRIVWISSAVGSGLNSGTLPQKGDVFGIYFASKGRIAHVGFIEQWGDKKVITVEGNTNTAGSREGDGVYKKIRLKSQIYVVANWIDL